MIEIWGRRERAAKIRGACRSEKGQIRWRRRRGTQTLCAGPEGLQENAGAGSRGEDPGRLVGRPWRKKKRKLFCCAPSVRHGNATGSKPKTDFGRVQANFLGVGGMSSGREIPRVPKTQYSVPWCFSSSIAVWVSSPSTRPAIVATVARGHELSGKRACPRSEESRSIWFAAPIPLTFTSTFGMD